MTTTIPINWVQFHHNQCFDTDDDQEEALSLCDLPTNNIQTDTISNKEHRNEDRTEPEEFEFRSCTTTTAADRRSPETMCDAEEVFFEGQILPLKVNRSASFSVVSSRIRTNDQRIARSNEYNYKPKIRNQFHSHPSPSPQIRTQSFRLIPQSNAKTSSLWSFLQVGLVKPQEIGLSDLKNRSKRFGSHNSSSTSSSSMNSTINDQNQNQNQSKMKNLGKNRKKKQRVVFSGGCKCSAVTIDGAIKEAVPRKKRTKEEKVVHLRNLQESRMSREGKQMVSSHRTFEWLKQLSIAAPTQG